MKNNFIKKKGRKRLRTLFALGVLAGFFAYRKTSPEKRKNFINLCLEKTQSGFDTFVEYCIPHERNGYKPRIFHHRSVRNILLIVLVVKVGVIASLFTLYPNLGKFDEDVRSTMYTLINQYRAERGIAPMSTSAYLQQAAELKGDNMIANNYFSHFGIDGKKPWQWLDPSEYPFQAMGENLAMDFLTAGSVFRAFQQSPAHDRNLLSDAYNDMGISIVNGTLDGHPTNVMVVFFGTKKTQPAQAITTANEPVTAAVTQPIAQDPIPKTPPVRTEPLPKPTPVAIKYVSATTSPIHLTGTPTSTQVAFSESNFTVRQLPGRDDEVAVLGDSVSVPVGASVESANGGIVFSSGGFIQRTVAWVDRFFLVTLVALILLMLINIFVKIRIQHSPIILNSLFVVAALFMIFYTHVHTAEAIGEQLRILHYLIR